MSDDWKVSYKGYDIAVGRSLHDGHADFTITKPGADGEPKMVRQGFGKGGHDSDDDEWSDAYTAAQAYIDTSLQPLV